MGLCITTIAPSATKADASRWRRAGACHEQKTGGTGRGNFFTWPHFHKRRARKLARAFGRDEEAARRREEVRRRGLAAHQAGSARVGGKGQTVHSVGGETGRSSTGPDPCVSWRRRW